MSVGGRNVEENLPSTRFVPERKVPHVLGVCTESCLLPGLTMRETM
jgi:hypothetical protein